MSHVEKQKRVVIKNVGISELEGVEGADRRQLENVGSELGFAECLEQLLDGSAQHSADQIARLGQDPTLHRDVAIFESFSRRLFSTVGVDRRNVEHEVPAFLIQ